MAKARTIKDSEPKKTSIGQTANTPPQPETQRKTNVDFYSRFTDFDISLFRAGKHFKLYEKMGSHVVEHGGVKGTYFAVWAPNAKSVSVMGNFNGWDKTSIPMNARWESRSDTICPVGGKHL